MKNELKCWACGHEWEHTQTGSYPNGPCPAACPKCHVSCCSSCGGEMGRSIDNDEMDAYTGGGCHNCEYTCCGGCI